MPRKSNKKLRSEYKEFNAAQLVKPKIRCKCGKVYSPTEKDARRAEHAVQQEKGQKNPVRFYQCRFGSWHWTRALYEVRRCRNCLGMFRPSNEEGDRDLCTTCTDLLPEPPTPLEVLRPARVIEATLNPSPKYLNNPRKAG